MINIYQNVLPEDVLKVIQSDFETNIGERKWMSSSLVWDEGIKNFISGSCVFCKVEPHIKNMIAVHLKDKIPEHDPDKEDLHMQYYVWQKDSGISWHNDSGRKSAATLYLNKNWSIDFGGLFVWEDLFSENHIQAYVPKYNSMIVNDNQTWHMVTPVATLAPENRLTIQMFINDKE